MRSGEHWRTVTWLVERVHRHNGRIALTLRGADLRERHWDNSAQKATTDWRVDWPDGTRTEGYSGRAEWREGTLTVTLAGVSEVAAQA